MNEKHKRILYVITKSNFGGAQRYVYDLAVSMKTLGHEVAVAAGGSGALIEKLSDAGIAVFEVKSFQRDINFLKEITSMRELSGIIRTFKPDVVHLNSSKAGGTGALVARLHRVSLIIFTAHGWPFLEPRHILWQSAAWCASFLTGLLAQKVIVVSLNDFNNAPTSLVRNKCTVIRTAVPTIDFKSREDARAFLFPEKETRERHHNDLWLVTNAELNRNKNLFSAIDAVVAFNNTTTQKIFYTIVGDGESREKLEAYISEKNAVSYITLLGYVDDARNYLKAFDIFLLPSKKEGMPYVILEAGAAGLPVVASRVGGIPEVIEHEKTGLLIDPNDYRTITDALETLVSSASVMAQLGNALRQRISESFSLDTMLEKTQEIYTKP